MPTQSAVNVGLDVSQQDLVVVVAGEAGLWTLTNDATGHSALIERLRACSCRWWW